MRRNIVLVTIIALCLGLSSFITSADEHSDWSTNAINEMKESGEFKAEIFGGYKENISRYEFIYIAVRTYEILDGKEITLNPSLSFNDTDDVYALKGYSAGITSGVGNGNFGGEEELTREALATFMIRILKLLDLDIEEISSVEFADDDSISNWARESIYLARSNNIISGVGNNEVNPQGSASKEMAMVIANRMLVKNGYEPSTKNANLFENPAIESAVRTILRKPDGELSTADFDKVKVLQVRDSKIDNYSDLDKFKNLINLSITNSGLKDFEFLTKYKNLTALSLTFNEIEDLTPLQSMPNLEYFDGSNNIVKTIAPVLELDNLTTFYIWKNIDLKDLSRLNENEYIGMKDFTSLSQRADFYKMIDDENKAVRNFYENLPLNADPLTKYLYTKLKLDSLSVVDSYSDNQNMIWYKRLGEGELTISHYEMAFSGLLKSIGIQTGYTSGVKRYISNFENDTSQHGFNVVKLNDEVLYTTTNTTYHVLAPEEVYTSVSLNSNANASYLTSYEVNNLSEMTGSDFWLENYAYQSFNKVNFYKKDGRTYIFRSYDSSIVMYELGKAGSGRVILDGLTRIINSKYISFDSNYGLYYTDDRALYKYDLLSGEINKIKDKVDFATVFNSKIFYSYYSDDFGVKSCNLDGSDEKKIYEGKIVLPMNFDALAVSRDHLIFAPYVGISNNAYEDMKSIDMSTNQISDIDVKNTQIKVIGNYLLTWEENLSNFKLTKNDGTFSLPLDGFVDGEKPSVYMFANRMFMYQRHNDIFIEIDTRYDLKDFINVSEINNSGK